MNSIKKGHRFERKIVKILERAFPQYKFWRVPLSGGSATMQKTNQLKGDILGEHRELKSSFPITIECKNNKKNSMDMFFFENKLLNSYLKQIKKYETKDWFLFLHIKNKGDIVLMPEKLYKHLTNGYEFCDINNFIDKKNYIRFNNYFVFKVIP